MIYNETDILSPKFRYNLDSQTYLTESESEVLRDIKTIPVIENSRLGLNLVDYSNIENLIEDNHYHSLQDIANSIQEANGLDSLTIAVDDYKLILHPEIVNEMDNIVIKPLSKNDPACIFTEACLELFEETMNDTYLYELVNIHEDGAWDSDAARATANTVRKNVSDDYEKYNKLNKMNPEDAAKYAEENPLERPNYFGNHSYAAYHANSNNKQSEEKGSERRELFTVDPYATDKKSLNQVHKTLKNMYKTIYKHNANVDTDYSNKDEINFNKIKQEYMKNPNDPTISKKYKESLKQYLLNKHDGNKITGKYKDDPGLGISLKRIENYKNKNFIAKQIQRLNNWARSMESKLNAPEKRGIWQKIKAVVFKIIQKLTKMLGADNTMRKDELITARKG